jgi:hypothetical protein
MFTEIILSNFQSVFQEILLLSLKVNIQQLVFVNVQWQYFAGNIILHTSTFGDRRVSQLESTNEISLDFQS